MSNDINPVYEAQRRAALEAMWHPHPASCTTHRWAPTSTGGGVCVRCGEGIGADEL